MLSNSSYGAKTEFRTVATDFSDASARAIDAAAGFGRTFAAKVTLLHAYDIPATPMIMSPDEVEELKSTLKSRSRERLQKLRDERLSELRDTRVDALLDSGTAHTIVDYADTQRVDLLIVGSHGHSGFKRWVLGSVAERVVRHANCDVLVVGGDAELKDSFAKRILVGTDFSDASRAALTRAHELALAFDADVCLAHVYHATVMMPPVDHVVIAESEDDAVNARLERLRKLHETHMAASERVEIEVIKSSAHACAICKLADDAGHDLIVLSKHGRSAIGRMLIGSVTEAVTRRSHCPVLVVRGPT